MSKFQLYMVELESGYNLVSTIPKNNLIVQSIKCDEDIKWAIKFNNSWVNVLPVSEKEFIKNEIKKMNDDIVRSNEEW